ncbi:hypothetical protein CYMTET_35776, partial [Cymbomonas tetramitiformis]
VDIGRKAHYCYDEDDLKALLDRTTKNYSIQRFKGLGEMMPQQLWDTTLNPETRRLRRLTIDDAARANDVFSMLMSDKVAPRRQFIETYGHKMDDSLDV